MSDFTRKLAAALRVKPRPESAIQRLYDMAKRHLFGRIISTPLPEDVHLLPENFPYWIKLQWWDDSTKQWKDAASRIVIPMFEAGEFSDDGYRLEDPRRARALIHIPDLLGNPDAIHPNSKTSIRGDHVYLQSFRDRFKVAFTVPDRHSGIVILVSSFQVGKAWPEKKLTQKARYTKAKAIP